MEFWPVPTRAPEPTTSAVKRKLEVWKQQTSTRASPPNTRSVNTREEYSERHLPAPVLHSRSFADFYSLEARLVVEADGKAVYGGVAAQWLRRRFAI